MKDKKNRGVAVTSSLRKPENMIKISVRVTPYIYQQLWDVARINGLSVSVVARAFLQRSVAEAESHYEDEDEEQV